MSEQNSSKSFFGGEPRTDPTEVRFFTVPVRASVLLKLAYIILCSCGLFYGLFLKNKI